MSTAGGPVRAERGEHAAENLLSLEQGAGPEQSKEDCVVAQRQPGRPARFADPERNAAYWARITRVVDAAPPLDDTQRAAIRAAFHGAQHREAA
ncbi:hypothetical protein H4K38_21180 [Streptomyces sp. I3(2020)]|nr:hypothetical protein [Streptomyces sp. I3(2020)]